MANLFNAIFNQIVQLMSTNKTFNFPNENISYRLYYHVVESLINKNYIKIFEKYRNIHIPNRLPFWREDAIKNAGHPLSGKMDSFVKGMSIFWVAAQRFRVISIIW